MNNQLTKYQTQLEQLEQLLHEDPQNQELLDLKSDLIQLIELLTSTLTAIPTDQQTKVDYINWKTGDRCQLKESGSNEWINGSVEGISGDKKSLIIKITTTHEKEKIIPNVPIESVKRPKLIHTKTYGFTNDSSNMTKRDPALIAKRQKQKQNFFTKKEKEHAIKQTNWQSFQKRLIKGGAPAAITGTTISHRPYQKPIGSAGSTATATVNSYRHSKGKFSIQETNEEEDLFDK